MNSTSRSSRLVSKRREIAGLGDDRPGRRAKADAEFARHDLRQRGLAEARGADEQHMVERLAALARRLDEDREIGARLGLADEFGQQLRAQRGVADIVAAALGGDDAGGRVHAAIRSTMQRLREPPAQAGGDNGKCCQHREQPSAWCADRTLGRITADDSEGMNNIPQTTTPMIATAAAIHAIQIAPIPA